MVSLNDSFTSRSTRMYLAKQHKLQGSTLLSIKFLLSEAKCLLSESTPRTHPCFLFNFSSMKETLAQQIHYRDSSSLTIQFLPNDRGSCLVNSLSLNEIVSCLANISLRHTQPLYLFLSARSLFVERKATHFGRQETTKEIRTYQIPKNKVWHGLDLHGLTNTCE